MSNYAKIELVEGKQAPRYTDGRVEVELEKIVITEQGTESNLPIVDFVMVGPDGKKTLLVLTGRIVNAVAAAIKGVNMRNHGKAEP
jgi:hypothetical protein